MDADTWTQIQEVYLMVEQMYMSRCPRDSCSCIVKNKREILLKRVGKLCDSGQCFLRPQEKPAIEPPVRTVNRCGRNASVTNRKAEIKTSHIHLFTREMTLLNLTRIARARARPGSSGNTSRGVQTSSLFTDGGNPCHDVISQSRTYTVDHIF